jgi:hypothetical protein
MKSNKGGERQMKKTYLIFSLAVILMLSMLSKSQAVVVFQNLGTGAPPFLMGGYYLTPFDTAPQASIPDNTMVSTIPGSPIPGNLTTSVAVKKVTSESSWSVVWGGHGYVGPVFATGNDTLTLYLPPFTGAFYLYVEPGNIGTFSITATANTGTSSGPVMVTTPAGATGFGFYTTEYNEYITSIAVTVDALSDGLGVAEFGIAQAPYQCVGGICYYNCIPGTCPASQCDVYIPNPSFYTIDVGQLTYHFGMFACIGPCPPTCKVYTPVTP